MRKLGIVIAITAAATLGFAGHASAQQQVCDVFQGVADEAPGQDPSGSGGQPVTDIAQGAADSCNQSFEQSKVVAGPLLCGVESGLTKSQIPSGAEIGGAVGEVREGLEGSPLNNATPLGPDFTGCGPDTDPTGGGNGGPGGGGGGGGGAPAVQAANAAPDGGLPRTGGELFAGAGFALMSLGALVRRFLP